jgi:protein-disulfide isomerase
VEEDLPEPIKRDSDILTIRLRRAHVRLAAMLLVGFALGYGTATFIGRGSAPSSVIPSQGNSDAAPPTTAGPIRVETSGRPSRGPDRAAVTLVEFTDYQCPYCARHFRETFDSLISSKPGQLRYVVRNFPVTNIHPYAQKAAEAAECAFDQGKIWEYHSPLFKRSPRFPPDTLKAIAMQLGLNMATFQDCLSSGKKESVIRQDMNDARHYGVQGTPTFFVNGRIVVGAQPLSVFQDEIDRALEH